MLSLVRLCRAPIFLPKTNSLLGISTRGVLQNGALRTYTNPVWRRQPLRNFLKQTTLLKTTVSVAVRLSSNIPQKGKKSIGYWLVTCSGMVFVAVVLGITIIYYYILVSICTVLEEVIKRTVR
jgi:hypothetical protein